MSTLASTNRSSVSARVEKGGTKRWTERREKETSKEGGGRGVINRVARCLIRSGGRKPLA